MVRWICGHASQQQALVLESTTFNRDCPSLRAVRGFRA